jgi:hypothetical protein
MRCKCMRGMVLEDLTEGVGGGGGKGPSGGKLLYFCYGLGEIFGVIPIWAKCQNGLIFELFHVEHDSWNGQVSQNCSTWNKGNVMREGLGSGMELDLTTESQDSVGACWKRDGMEPGEFGA